MLQPREGLSPDQVLFQTEFIRGELKSLKQMKEQLKRMQNSPTIRDRIKEIDGYIKTFEKELQDIRRIYKNAS